MTISQNIKKFRMAAKLSQPALAKACGWESQSRISMYETGKREPGISDLKLIAAALNIELNQLFNEKENLLKQDFANYEIAAVGKKIGTVPIISWVKAGSFTECINDFGEFEQIATDCEIREHTYALRVIGDSMVSDAAISFPEGIIIIVEPSMIAISGDFVIAINGDNEATFKQLIKDGVDWYLKPLNNRYPIKPIGSANVIGVVRQSVMKFK